MNKILLPTIVNPICGNINYWLEALYSVLYKLYIDEK